MRRNIELSKHGTTYYATKFDVSLCGELVCTIIMYVLMVMTLFLAANILVTFTPGLILHGLHRFSGIIFDSQPTIYSLLFCTMMQQ